MRLAFPSLRLCSAHKRLHDPNQKGYTCDLCGKVMLFKATLEAHMKSVHSDVKDFECDFERCGKKFKTPGQLRVRLELGIVDNL